MELKLTKATLKLKGLHLLIVPYGIETHNRVNISDDVLTLLIVPYGIETWVASGYLKLCKAFNRTLWN